jgi:hypothetical protein
MVAALFSPLIPKGLPFGLAFNSFSLLSLCNNQIYRWGCWQGVEKRDNAEQAIISNQSQSLPWLQLVPIALFFFSPNDFNPRLALNIHFGREGTKPMRRVEDVKRKTTRVWV